MRNSENGNPERSHGVFKRSMIVVYILGAYLIVNYVLKVSDHAYSETWKLVNFGLFVGLIYYFLRKPLLAMLDSKIADVDELLNSTKSELEASRKEREAALRAIDGIEDEIEKLLTRARELGEMERDALIADGKERARNIVEQAHVTLEGRELEIRQGIREEMAGRCVDLARSQILKKLTPEIQLALIRARISAIGRRA